MQSDKWDAAERWARRKLAGSGLRWTRKATRYFWSRNRGVLLEITPCAYSLDEAVAFSERAIVVIKIREFNDRDLADALLAVFYAESWNVRRRAVGLPVLVD
jgi:hypothetical protein